MTLPLILIEQLRYARSGRYQRLVQTRVATEQQLSHFQFLLWFFFFLLWIIVFKDLPSYFVQFLEIVFGSGDVD